MDLSLLENNQITRIACRRLAVTEKSDLALLAWTQEAKLKSRFVKTEPIDIDRLVKLIPQIRAMTIMKPKDFCPRLKSMLAEVGVALIFLPHLKGSFLQGASFVDGGKLVVGMTARGKDADKFWFSLFHELAHIILGHINQINGTTEDDEVVADLWAKDILISNNDFEDFINTNCFSDSNIRAFAKIQEIAPGIVVGRLQKEGYIKHSMLNNLKEHYEISV